ncbi:MAG: hypothetical protein JWL70_1014, partial [Acidimicrobiia bacterium]|nr:hypothetical protein [Acidimicrobiia bacterium]
MSLSPAVLQFFASHHGIASRTDLVLLGLSPDEIRHLAASGTCERTRRNVYRFVGMPRSYEQRAAAACAASLKVSISHPSAGRLWGLRRCLTEDM